jgi:hypothetical protein
VNATEVGRYKERKRGTLYQRAVATVVVAIVMGTACDSLAPSDIEGTYVMVEINGSPLPAITYSGMGATGLPTITTMHADTLRFFGDGTGEWGGTLEVYLEQRDGVAVKRTVAFGRRPINYEVHDGFIDITEVSEFSDFDILTRGYRARLTGTGLLLSGEEKAFFRRFE